MWGFLCLVWVLGRCFCCSLVFGVGFFVTLPFFGEDPGFESQPPHLPPSGKQTFRTRLSVEFPQLFELGQKICSGAEAAGKANQGRTRFLKDSFLGLPFV